MRKNIDKWNYYLDIIRKSEKEFIDKEIDDKFEEFYSVNSNNGKLNIYEVVDWIYVGEYYSDTHFKGKKPTRKEVEKISKIVQFPPILKKENIRVSWKTRHGSFSTLGMYTVDEIKEKYSFDRFQAEKEAKVALGKKKVEEQLIKNGTHGYCSYCHDFRNRSDLVQKEIIFQNSKNINGKWKKFVDRKMNWYCKDKPCHGHDQMAHEG